ncbi:hypothetical protein [Pedobacter sp. UYEF25]
MIFILGFGLHYLTPVHLQLVLELISIALFLILASVTFMFLKMCFSWYTSYMMNNRSTFVVKTDRPRVYIFSLIFPTLFAILYFFPKIDVKPANVIFRSTFDFLEALTAPLLLSFFVVFSFLLWLTLSKSFEKFWLPKFKNTIGKLNREFCSDFSIEQAKTIFEGLVKNDFLEYLNLEEEHLKKDKFVEIFAQSMLPATTVFNLKMDNIQTFLLYQRLSTRLTNFSLEIFLQIFNNKNLKASPKTILESCRKATSEPKNYESIEQIFSEIK